MLEFDPPLRLSYSWKALWSEDGLREPESRVTWEIEQVIEGVCKLTLVHDRFPPESAVYKGVGEGWPHILSSLKSLLETGEALPAQPATATAEGA